MGCLGGRPARSCCGRNSAAGRALAGAAALRETRHIEPDALVTPRDRLRRPRRVDRTARRARAGVSARRLSLAGRSQSERWERTFTIVPLGSRSMNRRTPHSSSRRAVHRHLEAEQLDEEIARLGGAGRPYVWHRPVDRHAPGSTGAPPIHAADSARRGASATREDEPSGYRSNPALAGIVGALREWTALITSVLSIPCRYTDVTPRSAWPSWRWMTFSGTPSRAISTAWA
jgi:hypothetical protein